jgi:predicted porin
MKGATATVGWKALAAAGLCALAPQARAQLATQFYGVADLSYGQFQPSGLEKDRRANSNSLTATFFGASATYGLESGWTPGLTLETFYRFQDLQSGRNNNDPLLSRNAFASLAHRDYGQVRLGRLQTNLFNVTTRFNALGNSVAFSPAVRHVFAAGNLIGVQGDFYWNRAVGYTSNNLDGMTVNLMLAEGESQRKGTLGSGSLVWARGLFAGSVAMQRVDVDDGIADPTKETTWQMGGSYNFGWAHAFGQFTRTQDQGLDVRSNIISSGLSVPAGPGQVLLQLASSKAEGPAVARKQTTWSWGYVYQIDSLTDIYALGMKDRVRGQVDGVSGAIGVRYKFGP